VKDSIGTELLHNFVETIAEFQAATDNAAKTKLKKESFDNGHHICIYIIVTRRNMDH